MHKEINIVASSTQCCLHTLVLLMKSNVYKGGVRGPGSMGTTTEFLSGTSLTLLTWSNVESSRAFPGWIRTRIWGWGGVHWKCGPLWNACLAMPGALGSTLDTATIKDRAGRWQERKRQGPWNWVLSRISPACFQAVLSLITGAGLSESQTCPTRGWHHSLVLS